MDTPLYALWWIALVILMGVGFYKIFAEWFRR